MFHSTLHAAANEIDAGRLNADEAADVITATLLGAYQAPTAKRAAGPSTRRTTRG